MNKKEIKEKKERREMGGSRFLRFPLFPLFLSFLLSACAPTTPNKVTVMLDWVPNVNHTGLFVAQQNGYFAEQGLEVTIVQPGEVFAEQAVAGGAADFGVSFQEQVTLARANDGVPLVAIAAVIQHNTSGFATRAGEGAQSPADWAGLRYGSFGSPFETPTLQSLMACAGGDFTQVQIVETGFTDPLALLSERQIDLAWIFFGTQGITAQQQGIALEVVMMDQYFDCIPDYYTPVLITSEPMIAERPDVVRKFVAAVSRGYDFAIENPDEAATLLHTFAPESDLATLKAGQQWLSPRYRAEAARWGEQQLNVWENYAAWMQSQGIIEQPLDAGKAFTNEFLP
jgi:ABC-type nitrate/sulfonate/bicarbonate transport system substrate-binding protein